MDHIYYEFIPMEELGKSTVALEFKEVKKANHALVFPPGLGGTW